MNEHRYVAKIEVSATFNPDEVSNPNLDLDHLEQIAAALDEMESTADFHISETGPHKIQLDLCSYCVHQFVNAPLGQKRKNPRLDFSQN